MTEEESAGVLFIMISPNIITVCRIKKAPLLRRRSIRDISRDYFGTEHVRFLVLEIDSLRHPGGSGDLANCECGRIHKALPIVGLNSSSGD